MKAYLYALIAHGIVGGLDVLINHELIAKLPRQRSATAELGLHSLREMIFAVLFFGLAWFEWHGAAVWVIAALLMGELIVSTVDTVLELDVRVLPKSERVAHVVLFVNMGVIVALMGQQLLAWWNLPSAVVALDHGLGSWVLTALGLGAFGWSVRDGLSCVSHLRNVNTN